MRIGYHVHSRMWYAPRVPLRYPVVDEVSVVFEPNPDGSCREECTIAFVDLGRYGICWRFEAFSEALLLASESGLLAVLGTLKGTAPVRSVEAALLALGAVELPRDQS